MNSIVKQNGSKLEENGEISVSHSVNTRKDRRCPEWLLLTRISCFLIVCTKIVSIRNMALWEEAALESERWGYTTERGCLMSPVDNICNRHSYSPASEGETWPCPHPVFKHILSLLAQVFLFPSRTGFRGQCDDTGGQDLAEFICLCTSHLSNSHQV